MKAMLRETKENVQGTNSDGKETGTQITGEVVGETHRGLGHAQGYPLRNQHQRGPI